MQIDFKKAVMYPFEDKDRLKKLSIGIILGSILNILSLSNLLISLHFNNKVPADLTGIQILLFWIAIPINLILSGYYILILNNEINNKKPLLPGWNITDCLKYGFFGWLIGFIYSIPVNIINFFSGPFAKLFIMRQKTSDDFLYDFPDDSSNNYFSLFLNHPGFAFWSLVIFILSLITLAIVVYAKSSYADGFDFKQGFNIKKILSGIRGVIPEYAVIIGIPSALYGILSVSLIPSILKYITNIVLSGNVLMIGFIGIILFLFGILSYIFWLAIYNLYAQTYKLAKQRIQKL